jgi:hypothetical protein
LIDFVVLMVADLLVHEPFNRIYLSATISAAAHLWHTDCSQVCVRCAAVRARGSRQHLRCKSSLQKSSYREFAAAGQACDSVLDFDRLALTMNTEMQKIMERRRKAAEKKARNGGVEDLESSQRSGLIIQHRIIHKDPLGEI